MLVSNVENFFFFCKSLNLKILFFLVFLFSFLILCSFCSKKIFICFFNEKKYLSTICYMLINKKIMAFVDKLVLFYSLAISASFFNFMV